MAVSWQVGLIFTLEIENVFPEVELRAHVRDTGPGPGSPAPRPVLLVLGKWRKSPASGSPVTVSINKHGITTVSDKGREHRSSGARGRKWLDIR